MEEVTLPPHAGQSDDERLARLVADYFEQVERGADPDPAALVAQHPDLAEPLASCLVGLAAVLQIRDGLPADGEPGLPAEFGDFEIIREIGRGGMGIVYEARQHGLDRRVALKILKTGRHPSAADQERFEVEVKAAGRLRHPGIVPVYQAGERDGEPFFAMEFVDGPTLADRLDEGPLPVREAAGIIRRAADAMEHAHQAGVVHRDLKPSNILMDRNEGPRISDFGLARLEDSSSRLTISGQLMGTPSYMSPEQAQGAVKQIGPATDVYALGAILYELLTGRPPFLAATLTETLDQVRDQLPVSPERLNPAVPRDLAILCLKCLQKEPARRYDSAQALARDLDAFLDGRPIAARPDSLVERLKRSFRRNPHPDVIARRRPIAMGKAVAALSVCLAVSLARWLQWPATVSYAILIAAGVALVFARGARSDDTLVERQVGALWLAFLIGCAATLVLNHLLGLEPLKLSPLIAVLAGVVMFAMASVLSGWFYPGAIACFASAPVMVFIAPLDFALLGVAMCFALMLPVLGEDRAVT